MAPVENTDEPHFAVLLAAYNGSHWLTEQLHSILGQQRVRVKIFISVDASTDGTETLVAEWAAHDSRVILLPGGKRFGGAAKNFYHLLRTVDFSSFDYVSLADQDDIWLNDKLACAHERLNGSGFSGYSGNVTAFWENGRQLLLDKAQPQRQYDFLFEAAGPGCSYVLKVDAALAFKTFLIDNWTASNQVALHDWLIYAWFRACGLSWFIDPNPKIQYRQHASNQVGANSGIKAFTARLRLLGRGWYGAQISQIVSLLRHLLPSLERDIAPDGSLSRSFLLSNFGQLRRRPRDRLFLFFIIVLGIY